ncbi:helix-turn-helix domain-containing protein [Euzebya sp.]|uniref:helix-turn-helix domain-containing protein n=1 Tax=Euzebya sp. TaxID=1971409 RepID=UPI003518BEA0
MDVEELADVIGANVLRFRQALGWSQDALATASGLSKGTIVAIEQHRSNPSVATLCALSETLGVGLATLLERPAGPLVKHRGTADAVVLWSTPAGSRAELLIGTDPPMGIELWRWRLEPGEGFGGAPHPRGTRETVHVDGGALTVTIADRTVDLAAGDVIVFEAHEPHRYESAGDGAATFSMWIIVGDQGDMPLPRPDADEG